MNRSTPPRRFLLALALSSVLSPVGARAVELFVRPAGGGAACSQPSPCSLATALATALAGDTIYVGAGPYTGSGSTVVALDKTVSLLGGWDGAPTGTVRRDPIANATTLDGQNARRVVTITGGSPTIDGFAIVAGDATGLTASCEVWGFSLGGCGGGILVHGASPVISNNDIAGNVAGSAMLTAGGEIGIGGGIYANHADGITIVSNTIEANTASTAANGAGGGVSIFHTTGARIAGNRILHNVGATVGSMSAWGGGVQAVFSEGTLVENNLFRDNVASSSAFGQGNALYTWYGSAALSDNDIGSDHQGDGAIHLGYWTGVFERNRVFAGADAWALEVFGGNGGAPAVVNNVLVGGAGTSAVVGAVGFSEYPLSFDLRHNTIVGNERTTGVHLDAFGTVTMTENIVAGNGTGVTVADSTTLSSDRTLFWSNDDDGVRGTNPLDGDPMFVNAPRGDYHIQTGSAAHNAGIDGTITDDIDREARPGVDMIDIGADELAPREFDFGTPTSPVSSGYTQVSSTFGYQPSAGFGWLSGTIGSRDRGSGSDLERDFDFTPLGTFVVDVPNGRYRVTVTMGDRTTGHGQMGVFLEGRQVASVSTQANEFKTQTFEVAVQDGQLTLLLDDLGGSDPNVVINALSIARALPLRLDLGTSGSPVASGYARVTPASAYAPEAGGGWIGGNVQARDRGGSDPLLRDFNFTRLGMFGLFLANGVYDLTVTYGDAAGAHDRMATLVQGADAGSLSTAAKEFVSRTYRIALADNLARVLFADAGGKDANVVIDAVEAAEPAVPMFDFGTATSPLASGCLRVTPATGYSTYRGYGWLAGVVSSRDRGVGDDLARDFNFTRDGTFVIDVTPGRYRVTVTLGDATSAHDQMGLLLEGDQVDSISTASGELTTRTYTVSVTDGQLTVGLRDLGGSDANAVVNAIGVR